jgi:apolipoprotein N-acyltransferase
MSFGIHIIVSCIDPYTDLHPSRKKTENIICYLKHRKICRTHITSSFMLKRHHLILLSLVSGLTLSFGWPANGFAPLLFIGFVPLLLIENHLWENRADNSRFSIVWYSFMAFAIWNTLTTYWIYNSTLAGAIAAILLNSLFMTIVFTLFHITRRNLKPGIHNYLALIAYWLSFEFIHLHWDLNWPWLNLGNGFANFHKWIQWYEYTGTFGGSLWILIVNIFLFIAVKDLLKTRRPGKSFYANMLVASLLIILPLAASLLIYSNYHEVKSPVSVVIVQPNIDPYTEQYSAPPSEVLGRILGLADKKTDSLTDYIVAPESAIQEYVWEDQIGSSQSVGIMRQYISKHKHLAIVIGISSRKIFEPGEKLSLTARKFSDVDKYYDAYNTALYCDSGSRLQRYHKSRLTPGVEMMPYPKLFKFAEKYAIDLGGTVGSLATDPVQKPFDAAEGFKIAPTICYESAYGEFITEFVRHGANAIFVITNDGWWGNTAGHRQHFLFSVLRAIETRRSVARSANTGTSAFINQRGDVSQATAYWVPAVIKETINTNNILTFYVRHGDFIARGALWVAALMLLLTASNGILKRPPKLKRR